MTFWQQPPQPGPQGGPGQGARPGRLALADGAIADGAITGGALAGVVTALVALGAAQLVAAILSSPIGAPVTAVGNLSINHTPPAVKNFAIREFGSSDKTVLVWGIRGVLIIVAAVIGILAVRKLWQGMSGLAVFGAIGVYAALSQPTASATDALPSLIGAAVAAIALRYFAGLAARLGAGRGFGVGVRPRQSGVAAPGTGPDTAQPGTAEPDTAQPVTAAPGAASVPPPGAVWWPTEPSPAGARDLVQDRRRFLFGSAAAAAVSLVAYASGSWLAETRDVSTIQQALRLPAPAEPAPPLPPGTNLNIPGLSSFITPNNSFYRVDTALVLPEIAPASWQLRIHGMVRKELVLSFADLIKRPLLEDYVTLCCVSNPVAGPYVGNARWLGASLRSLLQEAGLKAGADQLFCTSSDGFTSGTPVATAMDGRDAMLAVAMNGAALPVEHGFPVRLVIPGLYGYVSACKWIVDIEVTTYAANVAYWAQHGWDPRAPVKTESRIDVPTGLRPIKAGQRVAIAGVAWAQHKGIDAVEVRVAGGPWQQATLAAVPGIDCWRQWVHEWDASVRPGTYLIEARATDKTGYTQTALQEPPEPNGATGYPTVQVNVVS